MLNEDQNAGFWNERLFFSLTSVMQSFLFNLLLFYSILFLTNVPAYFLGLKFKGNDKNKRLWFEPPGFVIPLV